jgi:hypothetical protein
VREVLIEQPAAQLARRDATDRASGAGGEQLCRDADDALFLAGSIERRESGPRDASRASGAVAARE